MKKLLQKIFSPKVETLNTIFIDKKAILDNISTLQNHTKTTIFPVLKSNAYGHGILQMLEIFKESQQNFPYLVVDSYPEYKIIEKNSHYNILLLSETLHENYRAFNPKRTTFVVYNINTLKTLEQQKIKRKIHIFLNTGMNREGLDEENLEEFLHILKNCKYITVEGVLSHFYGADEEDNSSIKTQIAQFKKLTKIIENFGFIIKWKHMSASAGTLRINDDFFNASRVGLALYGYLPSPIFSDFSLRPALSLVSTITSLHSIKPGDGVSYNHKWKAKKDEIIATIPFGYFEGFPRHFQEKITYTFENHHLPQVGTICMNYSSCIGTKNLKIGDKIELISQNPDAVNSLENISKNTNTIVYEILVKLDKNIRRVIK